MVMNSGGVTNKDNNEIMLRSPNTTEVNNSNNKNPNSNNNHTGSGNSSMDTAQGNNTSQNLLPVMMTPYSLGHNSNLDDTLILQRLLQSGGGGGGGGGGGNNCGAPQSGYKNINDFNARPSSVFQWENISSDFLLSSPDHVRDMLQQSINTNNQPSGGGGGGGAAAFSSNNLLPNAGSPMSNILNSLFKTPAKSTLSHSNNNRLNNSGFGMWNLNSTVKKLSPLHFVNDSSRKLDPLLLLQTNDINFESTQLPNPHKTITDQQQQQQQQQQHSYIPIVSLTGETLNIPVNNNTRNKNTLTHRSLICTSPSMNKSHKSYKKQQQRSQQQQQQQHQQHQQGLKRKKSIVTTSIINNAGTGIPGKGVVDKNPLKKRKLNSTRMPVVEPLVSKSMSFFFQEEEENKDSSSTDEEIADDDANSDANSSQATIELNLSSTKKHPTSKPTSSVNLLMGNTSPTPKYKKRCGNVLPKLKRSVSVGNPSLHKKSTRLVRGGKGDMSMLSVPDLPKMGSFNGANTSNSSTLNSINLGNDSLGGSSTRVSSVSNTSNFIVNNNNKRSHSTTTNNNNTGTKSFQIVFTDPNLFESANTTAVSNGSNTSFNNSVVYHKNAGHSSVLQSTASSSHTMTNMKKKKKNITTNKSK